MDFQHFHSFYEIHILLAKSASHLVENIPSPYTPGTSSCCAPCSTRPSTHRGAPSRRLIINFLYPQEYLDSHPAFFPDSGTLRPGYPHLPL